MQQATVNVDGTGVVWWPSDDDDPLRYVTVATPWADANLPDLAPRLTATTMLAAVRAATPGIAFGPANVGPFVHDGVAFAHNGWLGGFRDGVARTLAASLPDDLYAAMGTVSDSVTVFMLVLKHLRDTGDLAIALAAAVREAAAACADAGHQATLNVAVTDGTTAAVTRFSQGLPGNSLYVLHDAGGFSGAGVVASEPLDPDLPWNAVPEDSLVHLRPQGVEIVALP